MTTILCTLYNSLYLDKGLVLYDSLCEYTNDFKLYVLCMDDRCYGLLSDLNLPNQIPVRLADFEAADSNLLRAKSNRTFGEYCWTCTPSFIWYVLKKCNESICTYIDADMSFYSNPQILVDEMIGVGKSVMVVPHRFPPEDAEKALRVGTYCVEFNTVMNNQEGLKALEYWRDCCLDVCSSQSDGIHFGDQKYLDELVEKFDCIHVCENPGAGMAPWNISQYYYESSKICFNNSSLITTPVFYHFQGLKYKTESFVVCGDILLKEKNYDMALLDFFYKTYLDRIKRKREMLKKKYNLSIYISMNPNAKKSFTNSLRKTILGQLWALWRLKKGGNSYIIHV